MFVAGRAAALVPVLRLRSSRCRRAGQCVLARAPVATRPQLSAPHHDLTTTTTVTILTLVIPAPAPAMPLRSRLPNTGLKLKIPARSSASVAAAAAASPYGPSPRHSASPSRKKEAELFPKSSSDHHAPGVPAPPASTAPGAACSVFDASVDSRPVWACVSSVSAARTDTGFREIPIRVSGGRGDRPPPAAPAPAPPHCDTARGSPVSPPLGDCELGPGSPPEDPLLHFTRGQFRTQRAQLLRDWISQLPTGRAPRAPRPNPFFSARKKDFNYEPYKYLSSPLPTFNQSPDSPAR